MHYREVESTREFVCSLERGRDWRTQIEEFAAEEGVDAGFFLGLGAVENAEIFFYDQHREEYDAVTFPEPLEVASCVGNVALLDGDRFAHTHAVCSRPDGEAVAGHLNSATTFAGELYLRAFEEPIERERDDDTDLDLFAL